MQKGANWTLENHPKFIMDRIQALLEAQSLRGIEMKLALVADAAQIADGRAPFNWLNDDAQDELLDVLVDFIAQIAKPGDDNQPEKPGNPAES